jgi:biopolymer transport protein ExbD
MLRTTPLGAISTAPLVGVALSIFLVGLAALSAPQLQTPLEVPRAQGCGEYMPGAKVLRVRLDADMSVTVSYGDWREVVPVVDLARAVRPHLVANRTDAVVYLAAADDVAWQDLVAVMDTLRGITAGRGQQPLVALQTH